MVLLPAGFSLPPLPYAGVLLAAAAAVGGGFARRRPPVTARHILSLTPWMTLGSVLHVLYVIDGLPAVVAPFGGTAAVYLTTAILAGAAWLGVDAAAPQTVPRWLVAVGGIVVGATIGAAIGVGLARGSLAPLWPAAAVGLSLVVTAAGWLLLRRLRPTATATTGAVGLLALFGHTLDGVSTAIGVDVLGFGERTPLSAVILGAAESLPTADLLGAGWLFVLVKVIVAGGVVVLFREYVAAEPTEGYALLGFVAAVGLGPGVHNLLLFTVLGG
jgi:uncharacterized membrane protein